MERSDPVLVPEWLKNNGNGNGGGGGNGKQEGGSSSSKSDDPGNSRSASKMSSLTINDHKVGRLSGSDQPTSSYLRRSSSSNSPHLRSYSSSDRIRGDVKWDRGMSRYGNPRHGDYSDPLDDILPSKFEKDRLRRSQSMITGKQNEKWLRKGAPDSNNIIRSGHKPIVSRNSPLDVKEIEAAPEAGSNQLPGLSTAVQGSQASKYRVISGSKTLSASSVDLTSRDNSVSAPSTISLKMDETLSQVPTAGTASQSLAGRQRLEELAIMQSRRLIPVTPSLPKSLVPGLSEKSKSKTLQQQQHVSSSSQLASNNTPRGGHSKSNIARTPNVGKLHVLKPSRENNGEYRVVSPIERGNLSPIVPLKSQANNSDGASSQSKPATMERKPTPQAQSRNDFFNLMRLKSSSNTRAPSVPDNSDKIITNVSLAPVPSHTNEARPPAYTVGESSDKTAVDIAFSKDGRIESLDGNLNADYGATEKELAFLRSLGWEEPAEEDEGLTEEEINAFYEEYMKLRPSETSRFQPKTQCSVNM